MLEYTDKTPEKILGKHSMLLPSGRILNCMLIHDVMGGMSGNKHYIKLFCLQRNFTFKSEDKRDIDELWAQIAKKMP